MFNFINDISNRIYLVISVLMSRVLRIFDFQEIQYQLSLFFHDIQVWHKRYQKRFYGFFGTNPSPHIMRMAFNQCYTALNPLEYIQYRFSESIRNSNISSKNIVIMRLGIDSNTSISFYESSEPLKKGFVRNDRIWIREVFMRNLKRFFVGSNPMDNIFSIFTSRNSIGIFIRKQQLKLLSFYTRVRDNLRAKINNIFCIQIPIPHGFCGFCFFVNSSAKAFLKKIRDALSSVVQTNFYRTHRGQRDAAFCIKESSVIFHIVTLYSYLISPATTKFEGTRINSSLCHSLTNGRKPLRMSRSTCPAQFIGSVGVEAESNRMPTQQSTLDSEWGTVANLRFLLSSIGSTTPNASLLGNTVYNNFVCGRESFAAIEQDGYSARFIYRPPIYDGPLALNASVGYKFAEVPRILNDQWVFNLRCTLA